MERMRELSALYMKDEVPEFDTGDTVKVHYKVVEGNRERIQLYQGIVLKTQGSGNSRSFTVRKISYGVGVERTFPLHSPKVADLEVVKRGKVRRGRLYYLRERVGKKAVVKEKR